MFSDDSSKFDYEGGDLEAMVRAGNYYRWIIDVVRPYIGKRVAEVGSGFGSFSKLIADLKPKLLVLVEPSKRMFNQLSKSIPSTPQTEVAYYNDYLKGVSPKLKKQNLDTVIYINVFEHIEDDTSELKEITRLLQKGGRVIIFVPALPSLYSRFDHSIGHYRRYTKKSLRNLAQSANLDVEKLRYMDMPGIAPWWFSFKLMRRKKLVPTLVNAYDNLCVPIIRQAEELAEAPIGKNLLLIAKKR